MVQAESNTLVAGQTYEGNLSLLVPIRIDTVMFKDGRPLPVEDVDVGLGPANKIKMGKVKFLLAHPTIMHRVLPRCHIK